MATASLKLLTIVVVALRMIESRTLPGGLEGLQNCTIPGQLDEGICRPVGECGAFRRIANESESNAIDDHSANREFVNGLWCGDHDGSEVCCPRDDIYHAFEEGAEAEEDEECGVPVPQYRIRGGQIATIDEFPWTAMLLRENRTSRALYYHCGGALISRTFVISAAHCVVWDVGGGGGGRWFMPQDQLKFVRLREYNFFTDPDCEIIGEMKDCAESKVDREPRRILIHPGFRTSHITTLTSPDPGQLSSYNHDLALLQVDPVPAYTDFLRPICLPELREMRAERFLTVAGWGKTDYFKESIGTIKFSPIKMKVVLPHIDMDLCKDIYKLMNIRVNGSHVCAGGKVAQDSCAGDSGSGLMQYDRRRGTWYLMGVASFGMKTCGREGIPGVYTNLREYLDWIRENIRTSR